MDGVRANRAALVRQMDQLTTALARERSLAVMQLTELLRRTPAIETLTLRSGSIDPEGVLQALASSQPDLLSIALVSPDGQTIAAGSSAGSRNQIERLLPDLAPFAASVRDRGNQQTLRRTGDGVPRDPRSVLGLGEARLIYTAEGPVVVAAVPLPEDSVFGRLVAISAQPLSSATIVDIGSAGGLNSLHLQTNPAEPGRAGLPLLDRDGDPAAWLVFNPDEPGRALLRVLVPSAGGAFAGIALFCASCSRMCGALQST